MININLLPWREALREEQKQEFLAWLVASVFFALMLVIFLYLIESYRITNQEMRNRFLTEEINKMQSKINEITELKKVRDSIIARTNVIQTLQDDRIEVVHVFTDLVDVVPKGVYLTKIDRNNDTLTIKGIAESNGNVSEMMRNIDRSAWIHLPELNEVKADAAKTMRENEFSLQSVIGQSKTSKLSPEKK